MVFCLFVSLGSVGNLFCMEKKQKITVEYFNKNSTHTYDPNKEVNTTDIEKLKQMIKDDNHEDFVKTLKDPDTKELLQKEFVYNAGKGPCHCSLLAYAILHRKATFVMEILKSLNLKDTDTIANIAVKDINEQKPTFSFLPLHLAILLAYLCIQKKSSNKYEQYKQIIEELIPYTNKQFIAFGNIFDFAISKKDALTTTKLLKTYLPGFIKEKKPEDESADLGYEFIFDIEI